MYQYNSIHLWLKINNDDAIKAKSLCSKLNIKWIFIAVSKKDIKELFLVIALNYIINMYLIIRLPNFLDYFALIKLKKLNKLNKNQ